MSFHLRPRPFRVLLILHSSRCGDAADSNDLPALQQQHKKKLNLMWGAADPPTPPFPLKTSTTCDTSDSAFCRTEASCCFLAIASGELNAPDAQVVWLGHPAQADDLPASCDAGPTQPTFAFSGADEDEDIVRVCLWLSSSAPPSSSVSPLQSLLSKGRAVWGVWPKLGLWYVFTVQIVR